MVGRRVRWVLVVLVVLASGLVALPVSPPLSSKR